VISVCAKRQRHCGAYLALQEAATMEWARAETLEDVRRAWGRFGGLVTLHRYGREHFVQLGRRQRHAV
jgi:hypothetical protein